MKNIMDSKWIAALFIAFPGVAWAMVLFVGGSIGPYAWWALILFSVVGLVAFLICLATVIIRVITKRTIKRTVGVILIASLLSTYFGWLWVNEKIAYPADLNKVSPAVYIRLPIDKPALVGWGGDAIEDNYHAILPCERWAYDLLSPPALVDSTNTEDYGIYGAEVLAPISGTVVGVYDEEEDLEPGSQEFQSTLGNYIFLRIEDTGTYLVLAHLKNRSIIVKEGQYVKEGTPIAKAGNSGASSEPHLHIHHQRQDPNKVLLLAEGLPLFFRDIKGSAMPKGGGDRIDNGTRVPNGETIYPVER